jgi:hypothetical protein
LTAFSKSKVRLVSKFALLRLLCTSGDGVEAFELVLMLMWAVAGWFNL